MRSFLFHVKPRAMAPRSRRMGGRPRRLGALALAAFVALSALGCGNIASAKGWAAPVALDGSGQLVLVQSAPGELQAIDLSQLAPPGEGQPTVTASAARWTFPGDDDDIELGALYATPVVQEQRIYVAAYSGDVLALDATTGRPIAGWGGDLGDRIVAQPVYVESSRRFVVVTEHGEVFAIDTATGAVPAPMSDLEGRVLASPALAVDALFIGSLDRSLVSLDLGGGTRWTVETAPTGSDLRLAGDLLIAGTLEQQVVARDTSTGEQRWATDVDTWVWAAPLVTAELVYVADLDGRAYALDRATGALRWRSASVYGEVVSAPALVAGVLVVVTGEGAVVGLSPADGAELWRVDVEFGKLYSDPLVIESSILYVSDNGALLRVAPALGTVEPLFVRS
jgi:outer membrane protein assembly factor BamB